jgi:HD-like signal output (HDOD) protein
MTKQPTNPSKPESKPTFQDNLFIVTKIFWKVGYSYGKTGRNEDFYARVLEDFGNLPISEFIEKYESL